MSKTKNTDNVSEPETSQQIVPAGNASDSLQQLLKVDNPEFIARYSKDIKRVQQELPTPSQLQKLLDDLPDQYEDLIEMMRRITGKKKGVYSQDDRPELPELRIYHGTGNDANRPEGQIPGEYYLTSQEKVGKQFEGTVLLMYEGRTMWGAAEDGGLRMPACNSMDRIVGTSFGLCASCPHRPWRDGQQQACSNDVIAYMLSKNLKDIVLVRFAKTSEPTGRQLKKLVKRSLSVWSRWYKIGAEARTAPTDRSKRWFVMNVEPIENSPVPDELHPFCDAMCSILEASTILPNLQNQYQQAQQIMGDGSQDSDDDDEDMNEIDDSEEITGAEDKVV